MNSLNTSPLEELRLTTFHKLFKANISSRTALYLYRLKLIPLSSLEQVKLCLYFNPPPQMCALFSIPGNNAYILMERHISCSWLSHFTFFFFLNEYRPLVVWLGGPLCKSITVWMSIRFLPCIRYNVIIHVLRRLLNTQEVVSFLTWRGPPAAGLWWSI